jgi:PucR C-terminal helix-turn-helix domain/GGDEF-like domain
MATHAQVESAEFQALFARVASPAWIRRVSDEITDAIHREVTELDDDDDMRAGTFASTRSVLTMMADMVRLGRPPAEGTPPPDAIEYTREFVRRGVGIDALLRAYHVGHSTFFHNWVAAVHAEVTDAVWLARAVELGANWTFDYVQALNRELVGRYTEEREGWVRSAAAVRAETVQALLSGDRIDVRLASQRLRYRLDRHHLAYVVWTDEEEAGPADLAALEDVALQLATEAQMGRPLVVTLGRRLVAAWVGARDQIALSAAGVAGSPLVAVGSPAAGVEGFCASHREAMHARRVARLSDRPMGTVTRYEDVALTALASVDLDLAREYVAAELGPLAARDDDTVRLSATLRVYLEERASPRRTAQRLGIHENTVKNRVRAIRELLGHPPEERVAEVLVALRLARLTHRDRTTT